MGLRNRLTKPFACSLGLFWRCRQGKGAAPGAAAAGSEGDRVRWMLVWCFKLGVNVFLFWRAVALFITFYSCADLVCLRAAIFCAAEKSRVTEMG